MNSFVELKTSSAKQIVYQEDKVVLYRFFPVTQTTHAVPLLIVFSLVNRPYILDISEEISMIKVLLESGFNIYLIDWGCPNDDDHSLTMERYIQHYLKHCVECIRMHSSQKKINILGICQGGIFTLCYASLYPQHIKNIITISTPVDFHTEDNILSKLSRNIDIDLMVNKFGNIPGQWLTYFFISLKPYKLLVKKYLDLLDMFDNKTDLRNFFSIEKWIFDTPSQAGETFRKFVKDFYQQNKLIKGEIVISRRKVNMKKINMPLLNIIAAKDYLVPVSACLPLKNYVGTADCSTIVLSVGHIGIYISNKIRSKLSNTIIQWLMKRI